MINIQGKTTFGTQIVTDGLVLYLDAANEKSYVGSGDSFKDLSGYNNDATIYNSPLFDSAGAGNFYFSGTNQYIESVGTNEIIGDNNPNITLIQVLKNDDVLRKYSFSLKRNTLPDANSTYFSIQTNVGANTSVLPGSINLFYRNTANTSYNYLYYDGGYNDNEWHMVAAQTTDSSARLYIDNILVDFSNVYGLASLSGNDGTCVIGSFDNTQLQYEGNIALTMLYNRYLTETELTQNYNALKKRYI